MVRQRIKNHADADTKTLQNNYQIKSNEPLQGKWRKSDNDLWFEAGIKEGVYRYDSIDSLGDYLIVEPYNLIEGNSPNYVLANFCPSITDNEQARCNH